MSDAGKNNSQKNNDIISFGVYFGQKDGILYEWANSLPWGVFSIIARDAIRAYLRNDKSYRIPEFKPNKKHPTNKQNIIKAFKISKNEDYDVYIYLKNMNSYNRSHEIKNILTRYLKEYSENEGVDKQQQVQPKREAMSISVVNMVDVPNKDKSNSDLSPAGLEFVKSLKMMTRKNNRN